MNLLIITHTPHKRYQDSWFAYGPYVNEIRLWEKQVDSVHIVAPLSTEAPSAIELDYKHSSIKFSRVPAFSLLGFWNSFQTVVKVPSIVWTLFKAMRKTDHIHLRCPGNMGLLGCVLQVCFPTKKKTAKYAGNWDPNAKQPWSYRLQKYILNNTLFTKNMYVLVYGNWPGTSKNIVPFFTASYSESKRKTSLKSFEAPFKALFVGGLTSGKSPLYAVQIIHQLRKNGVDIRLDLYGEGVQRQAIARYIETHELHNAVTLHGNQSSKTVAQAYQSSHFLVLPSQSEGWPKVVAEAMFWACIPFATAVSCVPEMLGAGERGFLLTKNPTHDVAALKTLLEDKNKLSTKSKAAQTWSQTFTLEKFEAEIKKLVVTKN